MPPRDYDKTQPLYYDQFFNLTAESTPCEVQLQDDVYGEYISIYGWPIDIYICTEYNPHYVFGEDPNKKYEADSFAAKAIWEPTPETLVLGSHEKQTDQEIITLWLHKNTVRESIKQALLDGGFISEADTIPDEDGTTKYEKHRRELQEGDMFRTRFNNIHYEVDSVKQEPDFQHLFHKYVYEVTARPRLVAGEELGDMQTVTNVDEIREDHENEIQTEANKILF